MPQYSLGFLFGGLAALLILAAFFAGSETARAWRRRCSLIPTASSD